MARQANPLGMVTIEVMPDQHRQSHRNAGNWGQFPLNGALRFRTTRQQADEIIESDPDGYAHLVKSLTA